MKTQNLNPSLESNPCATFNLLAAAYGHEFARLLFSSHGVRVPEPCEVKAGGDDDHSPTHDHEPMAA